MVNVNELMERVAKITESGSPIMSGREKIDVHDVLDMNLTVDEYDFLEGSDGKYVVITTVEYPNNFIYGSSVVTQAFLELEEAFTVDEINLLLQRGITFKLTELTSKNKRKYIKISFFPK